MPPDAPALRTIRTGVGQSYVTGLNDYALPQQNASTDFRVALRTEAWFRAMRLRQIFDQARGLNAVSGFVLPRMMRDAMAATGFWSVWLTVFADVLSGEKTACDAFPGTASNGWRV
ncbi:MAG: hypothetical protein K2X44_02560, partial [Magnetospirillum sp.]|nr:hypothetical protein [Magnetospirillum sp.]